MRCSHGKHGLTRGHVTSAGGAEVFYVSLFLRAHEGQQAWNSVQMHWELTLPTRGQAAEIYLTQMATQADAL